jgi:histidyl-tRNA synthetase
MTLRAVKGMNDILPDEIGRWQVLESALRRTFELAGYKEIRTPVLEPLELFVRSIGEATEIVEKQMFVVEREEESLALRPEGTAGVARAYVASALHGREPVSRFYYLGPMFRAERPQRGRYRQFWQAGVEIYGDPGPGCDAELIDMLVRLLDGLGVKNLRVLVNSLGGKETRARFREALRTYLTPRASELSEHAQKRLADNPLRILDSKDPRDQEAIQGAPPAGESLSDKSRKHFDRVQELLTASKAPFQVNPSLVRGFDYYTETLWEVTASGLGAQNAIGGGGRYDNLVESLGGRPTPGVGFGSGLERLLIALEAQGVALPNPTRPLVWLVYHGDAARTAQWQLLQHLRAADIPADMDHSGRSVKAQLKILDRAGARQTVTVGDTELANSTVVLKDLKTGQQSSISRTDLVARLKAGAGQR